MGRLEKRGWSIRLGWSAFIAGKRESRRLMGDLILGNQAFLDPAFPCPWHIDLHMPNDKYDDGHEGEEFISDFTRGKGYSLQEGLLGAISYVV